MLSRVRFDVFDEQKNRGKAEHEQAVCDRIVLKPATEADPRTHSARFSNTTALLQVCSRATACAREMRTSERKQRFYVQGLGANMAWVKFFR